MSTYIRRECGAWCLARGRKHNYGLRGHTFLSRVLPTPLPSRGVGNGHLRRRKRVHFHAVLVVNHAHVDDYHDGNHEEAEVHPKCAEVGDVLEGKAFRRQGAT